MARPKKVVLLYCRDDGEAAALRLALDVRGYRVATTPLAPADVIVIVHDDSFLPPLAADNAARRLPHCPVLVIMPGEVGSTRPEYAHTHILRADIDHRKTWMADLFAVLYKLCQAKRGPKPQTGPTMIPG